MRTTLYVYSAETNALAATITGDDNIACEAKAAADFGSDDYGWTYSPAFGATDGIVSNDSAIDIAA